MEFSFTFPNALQQAKQHCCVLFEINPISGFPTNNVSIRRSGNNQHYALICTTPLFYTRILAHTCFGSSLPTSGSFLDPSELLEIQINRLRGLCAGVLWFRTDPQHSSGNHKFSFSFQSESDISEIIYDKIAPI
jgi:hypothetical protein